VTTEYRNPIIFVIPDFNKNKEKKNGTDVKIGVGGDDDLGIYL
jgi:hypothetical protein